MRERNNLSQSKICQFLCYCFFMPILCDHVDCFGFKTDRFKFLLCTKLFLSIILVQAVIFNLTWPLLEIFFWSKCFFSCVFSSVCCIQYFLSFSGWTQFGSAQGGSRVWNCQSGPWKKNTFLSCVRFKIFNLKIEDFKTGNIFQLYRNDLILIIWEVKFANLSHLGV